MEIVLLVVVAVVIGGLIYINHNKKTIDTNNDGKIDAKEVKVAADKAVVNTKIAIKKAANKTKTTVAKNIKK